VTNERARTGSWRLEACALVAELDPDEEGGVRVVVPESSIFTLTTLR
jgi:hypothetical protein